MDGGELEVLVSVTAIAIYTCPSHDPAGVRHEIECAQI